MIRTWRSSTRVLGALWGLCLCAAPALAQTQPCAEGDPGCAAEKTGEPATGDAGPNPGEAAPGEAAPGDGAPDTPAAAAPDGAPTEDTGWGTPPPASPAQPAAEPAVQPAVEPAADAEAAPPPVTYESRRTWEDEEDAPPPVVVVDPRTRPDDPNEIGVRSRPSHLRPAERRQWEPLWGASGRLGTAFGKSRGNSVSMAGLGASVRYRWIAHFAMEAGVDFLRGHDWHDNRRRELVFSVNALVYFNPESTFQVYMPLGLHASGARVELEEMPGEWETRKYSYLGLQAGVGGEIRLSPRVALPIELIGFARGRTDKAARDEPEFVDEETKLVTNSSAGALFRVGATIYW